jgi:aminopeptidase N
VRRNPAAAPGQPLKLDGEALALLSLTLDGTAVTPELSPHGLVVRYVPDTCTLEIETLIDPAANTELTGLYVSGGNFFTQCEAQGFRRITYFPDRPDVMSRYSVSRDAVERQPGAGDRAAR